MKSINQLLGMPVVALQEGLRLGHLNGVEINAPEGRIRYLHFHGEHRPDGVVAWEAIRSLGDDAITVGSVMDVRHDLSSVDRTGLVAHVGDRPVVTENGTRLGSVTSYDLDEKSGRILAYHIATGGLLGHLRHATITFTPDQVRTFGHDAIIVENQLAAAPAA